MNDERVSACAWKMLRAFSLEINDENHMLVLLEHCDGTFYVNHFVDDELCASMTYPAKQMAIESFDAMFDCLKSQDGKVNILDLEVVL